MDTARFDRLVRSFGRQSSRRVAIRGVVASIVGGVLAIERQKEAAAAPGTVPLGGGCISDQQCNQSFVDAPFRAVCSDNGFDYDGPFNCCVGTDNRCLANEHCCGRLECIAGFCTDTSVVSLGLGEQCGFPEQCYSGSGTETTCGDNDIDFGGICCTFYGFGCLSDRHCCDSLVCLGGTCTVPYEGGGNVGSLGLGEQCGAPEQCYSGSGTQTTCGNNNIDPGGICCTYYGFGCLSDRHCCDSLICSGGVCAAPFDAVG